MSPRTRNRLVWVAMIALLAVLAFKTQEHFEDYFAGVGTLDVRVSAGESTVYLRWRGNVEAPMAARIAEAYEQNKSAVRTVVLVLNSPGGSIDQGAAVVRILRRIRQSHPLVTSVEAGRLCASMCVPIYLQGQRRISAPDARFMFHEVDFRDFFTKESDDRVPEAAISRETDRFFARYFTAAGVSPMWVDEVRADIAGGNEVWKTGQELVDEKSGVVQELM